MNKKINLSGEWGFCLDGPKIGIEQKYYLESLEDTICLPGTTALYEKGTRSDKRETGYLTEPYHFEGYAWYTRNIEIPEECIGDTIILNLERTRISNVWIDDNFVGSQDSFSTEHSYDLTDLITSTKHKLTVMVSNTDYKVTGGHMTSADTQTNWNGILGDISLNIYKEIYIAEMQVFPDADKKQMSLDLEVNFASQDKEAEIRILCCKKSSSDKEKDRLFQEQRTVSIEKGSNHIHMEIQIEEDREIELWNEYHPALYLVVVEVRTRTAKDEREEVIGFRNLITKEREFYLNHLQIMLRGKHDGMIYPLTGFAPMDKESWVNTFRIAKEYGINHYRFHTCCPPEAAFEAADEEGMYLEPELPFWGIILSPEEPEYDAKRQDYLEKEGFAMLKQFGNHPSFLLFSLGNELGGSQEIINELVGKYKKKDNRHWYTQGSNNSQFDPIVLEYDDFFCGVRCSKERLFRGSYPMCDAPLGHVQMTEPEMIHNYDSIICPNEISERQEGNSELQSQTEEFVPHVPVVSHEIGQYEFYPDFHEIEKYTGVLKPENLKIFRERLEEKGMLPYADIFFEASGKLAVQCYKRELETVFRSRELAGFQLLDLQDFTGQGTALIGILNAFMENKGFITAKEWRQFCSDRVLMLSFPRFVYQAGEMFSYQILMSNMNPEMIQNGIIKVRISCRQTGFVSEKDSEVTIEGQSRLVDCGRDGIQLPMLNEPEKLDVTVEIQGMDIQNQYEIYVYPQIHVEDNTNDEFIVTDQKTEMLRAVKAGNKVLFFGSHVRSEKAITGTYCSDFWCYPMFVTISESVGKPIPIGTMGMYVNKEHKALEQFLTEDYTTPQWWKIVTEAPLAVLDDTDIEPIVWMIDNFDRNHRIGVIFEAAVEKGKVLFCQANLKKGTSLEEKWLYHSLLAYIKSSQFQPEKSLTLDQVEELYE